MRRLEDSDMPGCAPLAALLSALLVLALALALPASASANAGMKIILDCTHERPLSGFSERAYRQALKEMPTEVSEYFPDCEELIRQAELSAAGKSHGGKSTGGNNQGGSGGPGGGNSAGGGQPGASGGGSAGEGIGNAPIAQTPAEKQAVAVAQSAGNSPVHLGGEVIRPGVVHANLASATSSLPTPLIALLALLLASSAVIGGKAIGDRIRRRRHSEGG